MSEQSSEKTEEKTSIFGSSRPTGKADRWGRKRAQTSVCKPTVCSNSGAEFSNKPAPEIEN